MNTEYTVQELLRAALGGPKMTNDSVALLHTLVDLILTKLSCEYETVTVTGYESKCLQQLLRQSKIASLPFKTGNVQMLTSKIDKLERLEQRMNSVDEKLRRHLDMVRACSNVNDSFATENWDHYSKVSEDICIIPTLECIIGCKIVTNSHCVERLRPLISDPMVDYLKKLQKRLEALHVELLNFGMLVNEWYKKIGVVDGCIMEVERLRMDIIRNENELEALLPELQMQPDAKLDRVHKVALKLYVQGVYDDIKKTVMELKEGLACARSMRAEKRTGCLSCGGANTCVQRPFHVGTKVQLQTSFKPPASCCGCTPTYFRPEHQQPLAEQMKKSEESLLLCKPDIEVLEGYNVNFYRKR